MKPFRDDRLRRVRGLSAVATLPPPNGNLARDATASRAAPASARTTRSLASDRLGDLLVRGKQLTPAQLDRALAYQCHHASRLGRTLIDLGMLPGTGVVHALSIQQRREFMSVADCRIDPRTLARVPRDVAVRHGILPLLEIDGTLLVGVDDGRGEDLDLEASTRDLGRKIEVIPLPATTSAAARIDLAYRALNKRFTSQKQIGEFLVERQRVTRSQLREALEVQRQTRQRLGEVLETTAGVGNREFHEILSEHLGIPLVRVAEIRGAIDPTVAKALPRTFAEHNLVFPLFASAGAVHVLVSAPLETALEDLLLSATRTEEVRLLLATPADVRLAIREVYEPRRDPDRASSEASTGMSVTVEDVGDLRDIEYSPTEDVEIPKIVNYIVFKALEKRASDVHIERQESSVLVRFRIDGVLHDVEDLPVGRDNVHRVLTKMKLDAKLDITERRRPLDGVIRKRFGTSRNVDFRLAFQPTIHGENLVIRLLDRSKPLPALEEIGFSDDVLPRYLRILENPQGMILFTGPTGSGKTTSLYATLDRLRTRPIKIITAEDPVEYNFDRIQQCQVNEGLGNTFARYLRGFLRQDPDVILIGEMRDQETAVVGVQAATTGHLLFSTLHTNDAVSTVSRLLMLGIEPDMLAGALLCVISQRLVRRVCDSCRTVYTPDERLREEFLPSGAPEGTPFRRGVGCPSCDQTGYRGRIPIFEFWALDSEAKERIRRGVDDAALADIAFGSGMATLLDDGMRKVRAGLTTLEELRRVIPLTQIAWYRKHTAENGVPAAAVAGTTG